MGKNMSEKDCADQVPPDAPKERILKVREILEEYGR